MENRSEWFLLVLAGIFLILCQIGRDLHKIAVDIDASWPLIVKTSAHLPLTAEEIEIIAPERTHKH